MEIRKRNQNKFRKMLKKYRQYIIVGVAAVVIIIICIVVLITSGAKYKKNNSLLNNAQSNKATNNDYVDVTENENAQSEESYESDTDGDPEKQDDLVYGEEVNVSSLPGDSASYSNGIDVSKWQGTIDWKKVAASGIDYAMIRIGYRTDINGTICEDEYASYNLISAQAAGIKTGVYFFSTAVNEAEAIEEAEWVVDYIAGYAITYPIVYNCEDFTSQTSRMYGITNEDRTNNAIAFMSTISDEGYDAMLYAGKNELVDNRLWNTDDIKKQYPLWIASYSEGAYPDVTSPSYSGTVAMWQYTNRGRVDGIEGYVDMNVAYFSYDSDADPFDPDKPHDDINVAELGIVFKNVDETVTAKEETNLRTSPDIRGALASVLYNGDTARRTGIGDNGWSRLEYEGTTVYAISSYLTTDLGYTAPAANTAAETTTTDGSGSGDGLKTKFTACNDVVTAKIEVNLRTLPSVTNPDAAVVAVLKNGETVTRTGINTDYGWSRVDYNGQTLYCVSSYLTSAQ